MLQRLRQISISSSLRGAFLTGALLTLIVSSVSLYSWHEQSSQIRYSLDEYFPRIHAAFLIEGNKPQQGTLVIPDDTVWIQGDEVRVHQVLVNVLSNALDACPHAAQITVSWQIQGGRLCVLIADNGPGWPAALLPSLLKPFTTSKTVGLGIGLSICVSLMTQMEGALRLASTFTRSACVVLEFNLTDVKDVE